MRDYYIDWKIKKKPIPIGEDLKVMIKKHNKKKKRVKK